MTDKDIQKKLNQIAKLAQELHAEAKSRYGEGGQLFMEPESGLHLMAHDNGLYRNRQKGIRFSATIACPIEAGAW
jgi:hypothetical protein